MKFDILLLENLLKCAVPTIIIAQLWRLLICYRILFGINLFCYIIIYHRRSHWWGGVVNLFWHVTAFNQSEPISIDRSNFRTAVIISWIHLLRFSICSKSTWTFLRDDKHFDNKLKNVPADVASFIVLTTIIMKVWSSLNRYLRPDNIHEYNRIQRIEILEHHIDPNHIRYQPKATFYKAKSSDPWKWK